MSHRDGEPLEIQLIGNATLLLRYGGMTLLTDPNFLHKGQYAYLGRGLVSRRLRDPALDVGELPALDGVLLSHLHGDHFDRVARRGLDAGLPVVTTPHAARRLARWHGFGRAVGLETWQEHVLRNADTEVRVTALPGRHAGSPWLRRLLPPVMGSLVRFGPAGSRPEISLYISGDTLDFDGLEEIPRRFPGIRLAVLHLGGTTLPGGMLVTMDAEQGVALARRLAPSPVLPVHYGDYTVMKSPLSSFLAAARAAGLADRLVHCPRGGHAVVTPHGAGPRLPR
ncbi:hypothetical protein SUDANB120_05910 [Streptomyces sp. enrichment culture]|uniref:MBL fold metallo-hydrolase n=1 Tax=Streptomyces sp. enrichment culture TaxID=1795815 RepID=UPI003F57EF01